MQTTLDTEICEPVLTVLRQLERSSTGSIILTAAPPAMVPSNIGLISMTFLTVCDAIQLPAVALESVATMIPPLNLKASVVVPWAILIGQLGLE